MLFATFINFYQTTHFAICILIKPRAAQNDFIIPYPITSTNISEFLLFLQKQVMVLGLKEIGKFIS